MSENKMCPVSKRVLFLLNYKLGMYLMVTLPVPNDISMLTSTTMTRTDHLVTTNRA